jgi:hypothetical protein
VTEWLTTGEVAKILGKSRTHVYRQIQRGVFHPRIDDAGHNRIDRDEVERVRASAKGCSDPSFAAGGGALVPWSAGSLDAFASDRTGEDGLKSRESARRDAREFESDRRERIRQQWAEEDARAEAAAKAAKQERAQLKEFLECCTLAQVRQEYEAGKLEGHEDLLAEILRPAERVSILRKVPLTGEERRMSEYEDRTRRSRRRSRFPHEADEETPTPEPKAAERAAAAEPNLLSGIWKENWPYILNLLGVGAAIAYARNPTVLDDLVDKIRST